MFNRSINKIVFLLLGMLPAGAVYAVDGVTLIDQRLALAGKVTPGDAPGFPITISAPGSYRLSSNLMLPDGNTDGIQIQAADVTLDLNGFSVIGPNTCTPNPTRCTVVGTQVGVKAVTAGNSGPMNVRVTNGVVRGMSGHGIQLMGDHTVVEKVNSYMNGGAGIVVGEGMILNSLTRLNATKAGLIGGMVKDSMSNNNGAGMVIRNGMATGNVANNNIESGLSVLYGNAAGNTAYNNGLYGIEAVCPGTLIGNTANRSVVANIVLNGTCAVVDNAQ